MSKLISFIFLVVAAIAAMAQEKDPVDEIKINSLLYRGSPYKIFSFTPDGKYLVSIRRDTSFRVEEVRTGEEICAFKPKDPEDELMGLATSSDNHAAFCVVDKPNEQQKKEGKQYFAGYGTIIIFDIESGKPTEQVPLMNDYSCSFLAFSHDGNYLLAGAHIYNRKQSIWTGKQNLIGGGGALKFTNDDQYILVCNQNGLGVYPAEVYLKNDKNVNLVKEYNSKYWKRWAPWNENSFYVLPDNSKVIMIQNNGLFMYKLTSNKVYRDFKVTEKDIIDGCLTISPDGKWAATAHKNNTLKIWDIEKGKLLRTETTNKDVIQIAFNPNGKEIIILEGQRVIW